MSTQSMKFYALHSSHLNATRNDLPAEARAASIEALNRLLIEMIDVQLAAKQAHWSVRGASFLSRHQLFDKLACGLNRQIDVTAERISALGGIPRGTAHVVASESTLKPYPIHSISDHEHLDAIASRLGLLAGEARISVRECQGQADPVTAHILTEANAAIERLLWLVESHAIGSN